MECRKIWRNMVCTSFTIQPTVKMSTGSPKQDRASTNCLCTWQLQYIFNFVYSETVKRTWWKPKKYFHLWPLQLLCGSFWRCHIFGDFWRWDISGGEIFSEHLATHAKAWHVSAACLAPAQLKGGCLLPEGSACDEYLLNLLTYPPTSWPYTPNHGGWWSELNGDKLPDF